MKRFSDKPIVAPIDFSAEADQAVLVALEVAAEATKVTALHVAPPLAAFEPGVVWDMVSDESRIERLHEAFQQRYDDAQYAGVHFEARFGDPGHEIAEFAQELEAGLIVMPSHGRTGLAHLLIGSVAEKVVRYAHCPVLVLRT
ncbi:MAG: universal stress protein [Planctomycetota bacterium]